MPAWGAAFQQESLWGEERSGGGSPAAVTAGCHGGPAPPAGLSRVERPKCAALSRAPRGTGRAHPVTAVGLAVSPRPAPRSEPAHPSCGAAPSAGQRRRAPRSGPAAAAAQPAPAIPYIAAAPAINSRAPPPGAGPGASGGGLAAMRGPAVTGGSAAFAARDARGCRGRGGGSRGPARRPPARQWARPPPPRVKVERGGSGGTLNRSGRPSPPAARAPRGWG